MSAVSVLSSAAGSSSDVTTLAAVTPPSGPVDTAKLVFRGNPDEWYCFMVLKKPKDQDLADAMAEAEDLEELKDSAPSSNVKSKKKKKPRKTSTADSDEEDGAGSDSSSGDEESSDEDDDKPKRKKKAKRRKQNTRTSIHCGRDPFGYVRSKNHEPPITVNESLFKIVLSSYESHTATTATTRSGKSSGHDQGVGASTSKKTSKSRINAIVSLRGSPEVPVKKRKKFSHHIVSIMGPVKSENAAKILEVIWNYKSRAVSPRVVWAKVIADKFGLVVWHDMRNVFTLKYYDVVHTEQDVYIRLKRTSQSIAEDLCADLDMFMRRRQIAPHVAKPQQQ